MFDFVDNIVDHIQWQWFKRTTIKVDWVAQMAILAYAIIFGLIMLLVVAMLS